MKAIIRWSVLALGLLLVGCGGDNTNVSGARLVKAAMPVKVMTPVNVMTPVKAALPVKASKSLDTYERLTPVKNF